MSVIKPIIKLPAEDDYIVSSFDLKLALLQYYRFKRQWVCVDEFDGMDVVADTGKHIIEVEVKVSRQDLLRGESNKKWKHDNYKQLHHVNYIPNKYYFCVPCCLEKDALKYAHELNPKYGVIVFDNLSFEDYIYRTGLLPRHEDSLKTVRVAHVLHGNYKQKNSWLIAKRASSKLITMMENIYNNSGQNNT